MPPEAHTFKYLNVESAERTTLISAKYFIFERSSRPSGPVVFWQLRDFVCRLGYPGKFYLHDWLKQHRSDREERCARFHLDSSDLRRSEESLRSAPGAVATGFEMVEFTISTLFLLYELASWCSWMTGARQQQAVILLDCFLAEGLQASLGQLDLRPPARAGRCRPESLNAAVCVHGRALARLDHSNLSLLLRRLCAQAEECRVCLEWAERIMGDASRLADRNWRERQLPSSPVGMPILRGRKRCRRLDEVVTTDAAVTAIRRKKARTASQYFLSSDGRAVGSDPENVVMRNYLFAGNEAFADLKQMPVAIDASNVGKGENAYIATVFSHGTEVAMWMPPQVFFSGPMLAFDGVGLGASRYRFRVDLGVLSFVDRRLAKRIAEAESLAPAHAHG